MNIEKPLSIRPSCWVLLIVGILLVYLNSIGFCGTIRIASGLELPVFATSPPGDLERFFILEQHTGRIKILRLGTGNISEVPFLTIENLAKGGEQGLLGLAFHPNYSQNGYFYVNCTILGGTTEIRRYQVFQTNPDIADPNSSTPILSYSQPQGNHNGGWLGFGPDGNLYICSGDGGSGNDSGSGHNPEIGNAQDLSNNLLGKVLRLDVDDDDFPEDSTRNYAIPSSNPFAGAEGDDEIWAYGLRNPWRASFDRMTGDFFIGDVGQGAREEINFQPAAEPGGRNYGWRLREGFIATPTSGIGGDHPLNAVDPVYDYTRGSDQFQGRAVTGGYVYSGPISSLQGQYIFADFASEQIWSIEINQTTQIMVDGSRQDLTSDFAPDVGSIDQISSFAEDTKGNLYVLDLGGELFKVTTDPPIIMCPSNVTVSCEASLDPGLNPSLGMPTVSENCEGEPEIIFMDDLSDKNTCSGTFDILRTWVASDGCGETSQCTHTITAQDSVAPTITCPPDQTVLCLESLNPSENNKLGSATGTDNCDDAPIISFSDLPAETPGCSAITTIQRTWSVSDLCGNENSCTQTLTVRNLSSMELGVYEGWNLISVPETNCLSSEALFGHFMQGKIWYWSQFQYQIADPKTVLNPNLGYWVYSKIPDIISLQCPPIQELATYRVTFEGIWSQATHPAGFPAGAHFTTLIGASHNGQVSFWESGGFASPGIERVAEIGQTSSLVNEISSAQTSGFTQALPFDPVIQLNSINTPGTISTTFSIHKDFPKVTIVSMIVPSPDWFIGIQGLDLMEEGQWVNSKIVELRGYDAGTEEGSNFSLSNPASVPHMPISILEEPPFKVNGEFVPVGRLSFERL